MARKDVMQYREINKDRYHRDCKEFCYWNFSIEDCIEIRKKAFYYDPLLLLSSKVLEKYMEEKDAY